MILHDLKENGGLINQVLEVNLDKNGVIELRRYALPDESA
jgi:hypothetical protein